MFVMTNTVQNTVPNAVSQGHPKRWLILALILAVECMDLLDGTIVNVAAPSIRADLSASLSALQWIAGGYALTFAIGLVTGGRLGDIFGRRRLFLVGLAGFTAASALCGAANSPETLIALRLVQGVFAAIMIPQGFGILRQAFPPDEIQKAFGLFGPVIGLSAVLGPVIGGALTDGDLFGLGWRAIFLVNVPIGIVALIGSASLLPESRAEQRADARPRRRRPDHAGDGPARLPADPGPRGRLAGVDLRLDRRQRGRARRVRPPRAPRERENVSPLVTMSLFRKRAFSAGLATALVFFAGMIGLMLTFSLYLQLGQGFSAIHTGLTLIPWSLGTAIGAGLGAGLLGPRFGRPTLHAGLAVMFAGVIGLLLVAKDGASSWAFAGPELLAGVGMGAMLAPLFDFVLAGVDDDEVGSASGVLNAMQQLGGALGIAIIGTIFFSIDGFVDAFHRTLWIEAGVLVVTAGLVGLLPLRAREGDHH